MDCRWEVRPLSIEGTLPVEFKLENNGSISRTSTLDVDDMEKNNVSKEDFCKLKRLRRKSINGEGSVFSS